MLVEDGVGYAELADIVEQGTATQPAAAGGGHIHFLRDGQRNIRNAAGMAGRVRTFGVDHFAERFGNGVEFVLVDQADQVGGGAGIEAPFDEGGGEAGPQGVVGGDGGEGGGDRRIEPAARAARDLVPGGLRTGELVEHIRHLAKQCDLGIYRDGRALQPAGPPAAVPMFVEAVNAVGNTRREAEAAGNVGAAGAARDNQFLGDGIAVPEDVGDGGDAAAEGGGARRARGDEMDGGGKAGADRLIALLEGAVVRLVKFANARRVAGATEVLEQDGVVEIVERRGIEAELFADVHADPAGADAMAGRLALGQVEGVAERADQFGTGQGGGSGLGMKAFELHWGTIRPNV
jgi:hypothetical protein